MAKEVIEFTRPKIQEVFGVEKEYAPERIKMSVEEWIRIPDNPIQRNTELHARKASKHHLKEFHPTHMLVSAAKLPDGSLYKLDGHTRAFLWATNQLEKPPFVLVDIYHANNIDDIKKLYFCFDNITAAETATDRLHGAYRACNFNPTSHLLRFGGVFQAMIHIYGNKFRQAQDKTVFLEPWIPIFTRIDQEKFHNRKFSSPLIAAMLLSVDEYQEKAIEFWRKFYEGSGYKNGKIRDSVQALEEIVLQFRVQGKYNYSGRMELISKALACVEFYVKDKLIKGGIKGIKLNKYLQKAQQKIQYAKNIDSSNKGKKIIRV